MVSIAKLFVVFKICNNYLHVYNNILKAKNVSKKKKKGRDSSNRDYMEREMREKALASVSKSHKPRSSKHERRGSSGSSSGSSSE